MTRVLCRPVAAIVLLVLLVLPCATGLACEPLGLPADALLAGESGQFQLPPGTDPALLVIALADCLGDPDPVVRDGIGYTGIATILRGGGIEADTTRALMTRLLVTLTGDDEAGNGFAQPFAALALAEVARVDRVTPIFTADERSELVAAAIGYIRNVRDYRGFDDEEGWRHGVAHGADFLMQIVLNAELDDRHVRPIVAAALGQVRAADGHAYVFGESQRLSRPVLFAAGRGLITPDEWQALLAPLAAPPGASWEAAFASTQDLAILHNSRQFLLSVYASVAESENALYAGIKAASRDALTALP
jgi:hypothetical protein